MAAVAAVLNVVVTDDGERQTWATIKERPSKRRIAPASRPGRAIATAKDLMSRPGCPCSRMPLGTGCGESIRSTARLQGVSGVICDGPMLQAAPDNEDIPRPECYQLLTTQVDAECTLPAHEQLVLVMCVPGERSLKTNQPQDSVVHLRQILRLPGLHERHRSLRNRDGPWSVGAWGMSHRGRVSASSGTSTR